MGQPSTSGLNYYESLLVHTANQEVTACILLASEILMPSVTRQSGCLQHMHDAAVQLVAELFQKLIQKKNFQISFLTKTKKSLHKSDGLLLIFRADMCALLAHLSALGLHHKTLTMYCEYFLAHLKQ